MWGMNRFADADLTCISDYSIATYSGMLPAVLSTGMGSEFFKPMGVTMIGGLITSTLLTLIVVPVIYSLLDAATERALALAVRHRPRAEGKRAEA